MLVSHRFDHKSEFPKEQHEARQDLVIYCKYLSKFIPIVVKKFFEKWKPQQQQNSWEETAFVIRI